MNDDGVLLTVKMIDEGIIPYEFSGSADRSESIEKAFSYMSDKDVLVAKRKFRKLWRKAIKQFKHADPYFENLKRSCGLGLPSSKLTSHHYNQRAFIVHSFLKENL